MGLSPDRRGDAKQQNHPHGWFFCLAFLRVQQNPVVRPALLGGEGRHFLLDALAHLLFSRLQVVLRLEVDPELRVGAEQSG